MPEENVKNMIPGPDIKSGSVSWESPSNIALIKYWGKKKIQMPQNPNLSFSLQHSKTITTVNYRMRSERGREVRFLFDGRDMPAFEDRINHYLDEISDRLPFLDNISLEVNSRNTFPHSAGIASSASAMSALALSLMDIRQTVGRKKADDPQFFREASEIARLGSGSAARSVYGGYVLWGKTAEIPESSDNYAIPLPVPVHQIFSRLNDSILVVESDSKEVSSSKGHASMAGHPYAQARYRQACENLKLLLSSLASGNVRSFISIVENEALSLHSLMLSSDKGYSLLRPETLKIIEKIRAFRNHTGIFITFTLDAGPNVHLIYPNEESIRIRSFIESELQELCDHGLVINDSVGTGPVKIK